MTAGGVVNDTCDNPFCKDCVIPFKPELDMRFCKKHNNERDIQCTLDCIQQRDEAEAFRAEQIKLAIEREKFNEYYESRETDPVMWVTGRGISSNQNIAKLLGYKKPKTAYSKAEIRAVFCVEKDDDGNWQLKERKEKGEIPDVSDSESSEEEEDKDFELDDSKEAESSEDGISLGDSDSSDSDSSDSDDE